jgi:hypothetical protein
MRDKPSHTEISRDHRVLIDNMLDGLDRLFDRESSVLDTYALVFATSRALKDSKWFDALNQPINELLAIAQSNSDFDEKRTAALCATDELRSHLSY